MHEIYVVCPLHQTADKNVYPPTDSPAVKFTKLQFFLSKGSDPLTESYFHRPHVKHDCSGRCKIFRFPQGIGPKPQNFWQVLLRLSKYFVDTSIFILTNFIAFSK